MTKINRRKFTRFKPTPLTIAQVDLNPKHNKKTFKAELVGLPYEEALMGCGVVFVKTDLEVGEECLIRVGDLEPIEAQVRWREEVDENLIKIGFKYLE